MRARAVVTRLLVRFTFVVVWSCVGWGALLIGSAVFDSFSEGSTAFARLLPSRGDTILGWLGALSVVLALGVGLLGGAVVASRRVARTGTNN
jgi:hypothetical protein